MQIFDRTYERLTLIDPEASKASYNCIVLGADGSVRLFDLRHLEHSTIVYEDPKRTPLLRLAWNRVDSNYIATVASDSNEALILDMRIPCTPVAKLTNHKAAINGIAWAPHSATHICTAGKVFFCTFLHFTFRRRQAGFDLGRARDA